MCEDFDYSDAVTVYEKTMRDSGYHADAPSEASSYFSNGVWFLRNCNGHLAKVGIRCKSVIPAPVPAWEL